MNRVRLAVSLVMLLVGLLWFGQGTGLLGGSPMTSQAIWAIVGAALAVGAAAVAWTGRRPARG